MIPVYILSSDNAPERLVALWADAERLGISITRVAAKAPGGEPPAVATLENHKRAWARVADGDAPFAAIIEDSVALSDALLPLLDRAFLARALPPRSVLVLDGDDRDMPDRSDAAIVRPATPPLGFRAYIVSRVAVRQLLTGAQEGAAFDRMLSRRRDFGVETFVVVPPAVVAEVEPAADVAAKPTLANGRLAAIGRGLASRMSWREASLFEPIPVPAPGTGEQG